MENPFPHRAPDVGSGDFMVGLSEAHAPTL